MKQNIKAVEQELKKIFDDDYLFEIPPYQRPYAWTIEHTAELLDDLYTAMGKDEEIKEMPPYFLGSIVLIKEDPASSLAQVIDGQQRLTTLTILFCVLRELSDDADTIDNLDKYVREKGDKFAGNEDRFRLSLRERDRDFFKKNIQKVGQLSQFLNQDKVSFSDSQQRMYENSEYLQKELSRVDQLKRDRLTKFLVQRCYLVVVSASDQNSAYRVFAVMNDRGLDLSPTDILKASIIGEMPEASRSQYTDKWEAIEDDLGREDFRELFEHIRMIHVKSKARGNLHQEFQDGVLNEANKNDFIDTVLTPISNAYRTVSRAAYESTSGAEKVNSYLSYLGYLDNYNWIPPAIAYFEKHQHDSEKLSMFFRDLERLAYTLFIRRADINERINRYANVLRTIEQGDESFMYNDITALELSSEEKLEVLGLLDGKVYLRTRVRKPLLLRLDSLIADQGVAYEHKHVTIEHVLPQHPERCSVWLKWFPEEETREFWTHKLANLVLLSRQKNSQAQNYNFDRKKQEYFQKKGVSTFSLTTQVLNENAWTPAVLEKRQSFLIDKLKSEWRLG